MQKIYHKRNELLEVEFFKDKECTKAFESMSHLYYYMHDMDIEAILKAVQELDAIFIIPYISKTQMQILSSGIRIERLENNSNSHFWTLSETERYNERHFQRLLPNLSKYIPEDNAVLFLSSEDCETYYTDKLTNTIDYSRVFVYPKIEHRCNKLVCTSSDCTGIEDFTKLTIFIHHGTQAELQKANEVAKELKEKHGVEKVSVFMLHCFVPTQLLLKVSSFLYREIDGRYNYALSGYQMQKICQNIDKIITTNSTGLLKPENDEKLQVIDCFDIFNNSL